AAFAAYFRDARNIDDDAVLTELAGADAVAAARADAVKGRLRANTQEAIGRGGFGSPTMFVDGEDMYFGNDQLPLVERALQRK
ncbi:MAG: DsbA family protein, partial [Steroidobacteraceae bacterium]